MGNMTALQIAQKIGDGMIRFYARIKNPVFEGNVQIKTNAGDGSPVVLTKNGSGKLEVDGSEVKTAAVTENFSASEKAKLAGLESSKFLGTYPNFGALNTANPAPADGSYGDVDTSGSDVIRYIWDTSENDFVEQSGVVSGETSASVKAKYEANADTNAFTDADKTKLETAPANIASALAGKEGAFPKNSAFNKDWGTSADTVCQGNDSRVINAVQGSFTQAQADAAMNPDS